MELVSLADDLDAWTDWDGAAYALGRTLGLFQGADFLSVKHIFWADNHLGNGLHEALIALVSAGVLARRDDPDEQSGG